MTKKDESVTGDFEDAFSNVPHASGLHLLLAVATLVASTYFSMSLVSSDYFSLSLLNTICIPIT